MPSSDTTLHKAIVHNVSDAGVYVKIPSLLGSSESIALYKPRLTNDSWPPSVGDQLLVAVEGDNFNRVYAISNIDNQYINYLTEIADGSITTNKLANTSVTTNKLANASVTTDKLANASVTENKLGFAIPGVGPPTLKVNRVSPQSIPGLTATFVSFDTENSDSSGLITVPSSTITIPVGMSGLYAVSIKVTRVSGSSFIGVSFRVNNTQNIFEVAPPSATVLTGGILYLEGNDTGQLRIESNTTVTVTATLWMTRILS